MAHIVANSGAKTARFPIHEQATVGRDPGCEIVLDDALVSRRHASISFLDGAYVIRDLGSSHGTFVGGARVESARLEPGAEVRIGATTLRIEVPDVVSPAASIAPLRRWLALDPKPTFRPARELDPISLRRQYERLRATYAISRAIGVEQDVDRLVDKLIDALFELVPGDRAAVVVFDPTTRNQRVKVARTRIGSEEEFDVPRAIIDEVVKTKSALLSADAVTDTRLSRSASVYAAGVRSAMCVPMVYDDDVLGLLEVDTIAADAFNEYDLELLGTIAGQAALAMKTALLRESVREQEARVGHATRLATVGQLAGSVANEFNDILKVILTTVGHAERVLGHSNADEQLSVLRAAAERGVGLTRQLLGFSRRQVVAPKAVSLGPVLTAVKLMLERMLGARHRMTIDVARGLPMVEADPARIEQVLFSLISNARDAMEEPGTVEIGLDAATLDTPRGNLAPGDYVRLRVRDSGVGMGPEVQRRIFEPFFTTKAPGHGTGLGLTAVLGTVREIKGDIFVTSTPGVGTTFEVYLPVLRRQNSSKDAEGNRTE